MIAAIASPVASLLAKLALAVLLLSAGAGAGWHAHGKWIAGDWVEVQRRLDNATQVAVTLEADQNSSRISLGALEEQVRDCQDRTAKSQARESAQLEQKRKSRLATPANATRQDEALVEALNTLFTRGQ